MSDSSHRQCRRYYRSDCQDDRVLSLYICNFPFDWFSIACLVVIAGLRYALYHDTKRKTRQGQSFSSQTPEPARAVRTAPPDCPLRLENKGLADLEFLLLSDRGYQGRLCLAILLQMYRGRTDS